MFKILVMPKTLQNAVYSKSLCILSIIMYPIGIYKESIIHVSIQDTVKQFNSLSAEFLKWNLPVDDLDYPF